MPDFLDKWAVTMVSGGKPVVFPGHLSFPAVASLDGKHSIVILAHQLRVYFLQTRQCIRTVDVDVSDAVAAALDPGNDNQLVVFTPLRVFYVNWKERLDNPVVATQPLEPALPGLVDVFHLTEHAYFAVTKDDETLTVVKIDRELATTSKLFKADQVTHHAVSKQGFKLAVALESQAVAIYDLTCLFSDILLPQTAVAATMEKHTLVNKPVTCMAVSDDGVVALGGQNGVILLVYSGFGSEKATKLLRWHIDPVRCLAFSHDQQYLVSGGNEKVLVFWHLDLDRTQYLPRLSGPLDRIFVDANRPDHYLVALRVDDPSSASPVHEILTILASDLVSRLSVSPIRPNFASSARLAEARIRKKLVKTPVNLGSVKNNVTAPVAVHPTTRHLYCATGPAIQAFDVVRGEQAFVQHAAPQISTGRVKSEHNVADPTVSEVAFTSGGTWMATFDSMPTLDFDNLMLKDDTSYALKFWKLSDNGWQLALKVVDPHGPGVSVGAVVAGIDESFTTVDVKGGVRVWRPKASVLTGQNGPNGTLNQKNTPATVWTLRRSSRPTAHSARVSGCYSADGSLLVVAHGFLLTAMDPHLLQPIAFKLPVSDLPIEKIAITGSHLIIASQSRLVSFDLVKGRETQLSARVSNVGVGNLVAVDTSRELVAVATNHFTTDSDVKLQGKLMVFKPSSLEPVYTSSYPLAIASVSVASSGFVVIDTESRVGVLAPQMKSNLADTEDLVSQMEKVLVSAQAAANVLHARSAEQNAQKQASEQSTDKWTSHKLIDTAVLQPIFNNVEGVSMDTLFEKIVRAVQ